MSAALDRGARVRFNGMLMLASEGLALTRTDGTVERHPWSWVLAARVDERAVQLRLDERGGRAWVRVSLAGLAERGVAEQVRAHLRQAGKLPTNR